MTRRRGREAGGEGDRDAAAGDGGTGEESAAIDPAELTRAFVAPTWLRELGTTAWLLVGIAALLAGAIVLLSMTSTIVVPVIAATIVAAVLSPLITLVTRRGVGRGAATAIVFALIVLVAVTLTVLILASVTSKSQSLVDQLRDGASAMRAWLEDLGVSTNSAQQAQTDASSGVSDAFHALLKGVGTGLESLASIGIFLSFSALSLIFLLKDGPTIRRWAESHMGVAPPVAQAITERTAQALRGYFVGVTAVAAFNAVVIGLAALILDVPQAGTIAVVNFVAAYVPYLGAWTAGAFTVLLALGSQGSEIALVMAIIVLLANGALQQLIQPIAYGAALGIHPLAVLIVTIAGGSLFGAIGLILAAPLTSAATKISKDLARGRAAPETGVGPAQAESDVGGGPAAPASESVPAGP